MPQYQKCWCGQKLPLLLAIGLTYLTKIGGDQSPRPHTFRRPALLSTQRKLGSFDKMTLVFCQMFLYFYLYLFYCYTITYFLLTYTLIVHSYSPATNQQICSQILKENILIWKDQFRKVHITDLFQMRFMINKKSKKSLFINIPMSKLHSYYICNKATKVSFTHRAQANNHIPKIKHPSFHGLQTPNEGINQRYLKNWADVAEKLCFGRT